MQEHVRGKWRIQTEYFPWHPEMSWQNMCFAFNFVPTSEQEAIRDGMGTLDNVHFLTYTERPFEQAVFADAEHIFAEILPEEAEVNEKTGILKKLLHKRQEDEGNRVPLKM